jgi:glycosyltransferase involved in cell wall biosynthesis
MTIEGNEEELEQTSRSDIAATDKTASRPIRIMHIIDKLGVSGSSIHGITQALTWWIPHFDPQQFEFHVVSLRAREAGGEVLARVGIPVTFLSKGKLDPTTIPALLALVKREKPDVLHLHGFGAANFGRIVSRLTRIPNIVHEHAVIQDQPLYQTVADAVLSPLTDRAIAISKPVHRYMVEGRKINPDKLVTFFYGIPLDSFRASEPEVIAQKRAELGIAPDAPVVCSVGRLDTLKGQSYLIRAAAMVARSLPQVRFVIVGNGPDMAMLTELAREAGVSENVIFTGFRPDVADMVSMADVIALPSLSEGGPITLFEAMQMHKPVVGTPAGMMPEVIHEGETGFIVPVKSVETLAEKLLYLLENPEEARQMGEKGWEVCQQYDLIHSVQQLSQIYREMTAR